jgi:hypothetical protein
MIRSVTSTFHDRASIATTRSTTPERTGTDDLQAATHTNLANGAGGVECGAQMADVLDAVLQGDHDRTRCQYRLQRSGRL